MAEGTQGLVDAWPLFGLVVRSERLELRLPREDELVELLELAKSGIHDTDYMPFGFAWTDQASPQLEHSFMQYHWRIRSAWSADEWVLDFGVWFEGRLVGSQGMRGEKFAVFKSIGTGSWLARRNQGLKIGREMRSAVLSFAFDHLGAEQATSAAFMDNAPSVGVSRSLGYADNGFQWMAPRGVPRQEQRFLMTREMWHSRERPPITVEGFDACRAMFGL